MSSCRLVGSRGLLILRSSFHSLRLVVTCPKMHVRNERSQGHWSTHNTSSLPRNSLPPHPYHTLPTCVLIPSLRASLTRSTRPHLLSHTIRRVVFLPVPIAYPIKLAVKLDLLAQRKAAQETAEAFVVREVVELEAPNVAIECLKLFRKLDREDLHRLHFLLPYEVPRRACRRPAYLAPWKRASQEVQQHVRERLEVVPPRRFYKDEERVSHRECKGRDKIGRDSPMPSCVCMDAKSDVPTP